MELADKGELFPQAAVHPLYRMGARAPPAGSATWYRIMRWQLGLGADLTAYAKPAVLGAAGGNYPVSCRIFLGMRPGLCARGRHP